MCVLDDIKFIGKISGIGLCGFVSTIFIGYIPHIIALYVEAFGIFIVVTMVPLLCIDKLVRCSIEKFFSKFHKNEIKKQISQHEKNMFDRVSMNDIISHKHGYYFFMKYLMKEFCVENLVFLTEVEFLKKKFLRKCVNTTSNIGSDSLSDVSHASQMPLKASNVVLSEKFDHDEKDSNLRKRIQNIKLPKTKHLQVSSVMQQPTFVDTVLMMIDIFIEANSINEINVSSYHKKKFFKQPTIIRIMKGTFDESQLAVGDLAIFDGYQTEAYMHLEDCFKRFQGTREYHRILSVKTRLKPNANRDRQRQSLP